MNDLLIIIFGSSATITLILSGLFGWLGKRYLDKILEEERNANLNRLTLLQSDISKDVERHKSKLKINEKFFNNQLEASFKLYKIMKDMVPERTHQDMDWYEACDQIAHDFEKIKNQLSEFLEKHYTTLPPEIYEKLQETEYLCSNGKLEVSSPEITSSVNKIADEVFQNIKYSCIKLKSYIDGQREIKESEPFTK
jgi:uncharacterized protein with NRDE domain